MTTSTRPARCSRAVLALPAAVVTLVVLHQTLPRFGDAAWCDRAHRTEPLCTEWDVFRVLLMACGGAHMFAHVVTRLSRASRAAAAAFRPAAAVQIPANAPTDEGAHPLLIARLRHLYRATESTCAP